MSRDASFPMYMHDDYILQLVLVAGHAFFMHASHYVWEYNVSLPSYVWVFVFQLK